MDELQVRSADAARFLERLRREFPLEVRIAGASASARGTYARILASWLGPDAPPAAAGFPQHDLAELAKLDAVAITDRGVSAYPFSAADTGITVVMDGRRIGAMCAIDALAVPLLANANVTIEASCEQCGKGIALEARADGSWRSASTTPIRVRHPSRQDFGSACCSDLCPTIRFVYAGCESGALDEYLGLDEAIVVARGMFAFQVPLIRAQQHR